MDYSVTQAANVAAIAGAIVVIARLFKFELNQEEVAALLGAAIVIISAITSFVNRYKKGDLNLAGFRK